jgi:hypothetical protein
MMTTVGNGPAALWFGVVFGILLLVLGGLSSLILWNISQLTIKVDTMQIIVYETRGGLKGVEERLVQTENRVSKQEGSMETALGHRR